MAADSVSSAAADGHRLSLPGDVAPRSASPSPPGGAPRRAWTGTDGLVLISVVVWGTNYSIVKVLLQTLSPRAFGAVRLGMASVAFVLVIGASAWMRARQPKLRDTIVDLTPGGDHSLSILRTTRLTGRDWFHLALLGIVGHFMYQTLFIEGLARTSVANASLIIGCTPIGVAMLSAALGWERLGLMHWLGAALSFAGIYLVVSEVTPAGGAPGLHPAGTSNLIGDLMIFAGVICWTTYTVAGKKLLQRHSPLVVTGYSMAIGTLAFLLFSADAVLSTNWRAMSGGDWAGISYSSLIGLNVSYVLWYAGVQRLGSSRTSIYANLTPIVSLIVAAVWLGERFGPMKLIGAAAVLCGLALTRVRLAPRHV